MKRLVLKIEDRYFRLLLSFLRTLDYVTILQPEEPTADPGRYDFSDLAGKLEWKGDALVQQRQLRDEW